MSFGTGWLAMGHEYLQHEEDRVMPRTDGATGRHRPGGARRGIFSVYGHRLSSLYRDTDLGALTLTAGYHGGISSCRKYSRPSICTVRDAWTLRRREHMGNEARRPTR